MKLINVRKIKDQQSLRKANAARAYTSLYNGGVFLPHTQNFLRPCGFDFVIEIKPAFVRTAFEAFVSCYLPALSAQIAATAWDSRDAIPQRRACRPECSHAFYDSTFSRWQRVRSASPSRSRRGLIRDLADA